MDSLDRFVAFALGLAPKATHVPYFDFSYVDRESGRGPRVASACRLASGVIGAEAVKILLQRGEVRPAPHYHQFDPYRYLLKHGRLRMGNRGPIQRMKRRVMRKTIDRTRFQSLTSRPAPRQSTQPFGNGFSPTRRLHSND